MSALDLRRRLWAEAVGTAFLLATVVGSGIMAERLAGGNVAIALLGNTIPTGAILVVLITALGPVSGAHFNPAVTLAFLIRREIEAGTAALYVLFQVIGGILGTLVAHAMFEEALLQYSTHVRTGPVAGGGCRHLRVGRNNFCVDSLASGRCGLDGGTLYHGGLLVHRIDKFC